MRRPRELRPLRDRLTPTTAARHSLLPTSPIAVEPPGVRAHARPRQSRQTDMTRLGRLAICVWRLGEEPAPVLALDFVVARQ